MTMSDTESSEADASTVEPSLEDSTQEVALDVRGLTKIYPDGTLAVDDIDFSINDGDFCVLIGPSGCGKSTTLHSLVGKIPVTEGKIRLGDEGISATVIIGDASHNGAAGDKNETETETERELRRRLVRFLKPRIAGYKIPKVINVKSR